MDESNFTDKRILALCGNRYQSGHIRLLQRFIRLLAEAGFSIIIHFDFYDYLREAGVVFPAGTQKCSVLPPFAEAVISVGGDGTFLHSAAWVGSLAIPVVGVNTGHLGYLAHFGINDMDHLVESLRQRSLRVQERAMLSLSSDHIDQGANPDFPLCALNEIALLKDDTSSMITVDTTIDGRELTQYRADGLIVSTATGSTGYNMSAGGPLLQPTLDAAVITPVAPHSLTLRPLVVDASSVIRARTESRSGKYRVSIDGNSFILPSGTEVEIRRAPYRLRVLIPADTDFAATLRRKLRWGSF